MATEAQIQANRENAKKAGRKKGSKAQHTLDAQTVKQLYIELAKEHALPVAQALLKKALKGDIAAIKEFNDRAFGKAPQSVDVGGKLTIADVLYAISNGTTVKQ